MKYTAKQFNKKKIKYQKYIIFLLLVIFFFLGSFNERYDWKKKVKFFINSTFQNIIAKVLYQSNYVEKIYLDIKLDDYKYLTSVRNKKILKKYVEDEDEWTNIDISTEPKKKIKAEIKLKGQLEDHFQDEKKWSFKIKISDKANIKGLTRFTLQPPETLNFLNEWLFIKDLQQKKLISLKTDFVELILNGENLGLYIIQESISNSTLETNNRRDGPIIGFDNDNWLIEVNNFGHNSINSMEQSYFRSKIKPVRLSKNYDVSSSDTSLKKAIYLLDSFRRNSLKTSEVFDTDQLINALISKAMFAAVQFDWADMNFYYNPFTNLLEPILKEVHTIDKFELHQNNWWLDSYSPIEDRTQTEQFLDQIYSDIEFYEKYLKKLNKTLQEDNYLDVVIKNNYKDFNLYYSLLKKNFPFKKVFGSQDLDVFAAQKKKMLDALNPKLGLNVFFAENEFDTISFNVNNLQRLPIKIVGLKDLTTNKILLIEENDIVKGFQSPNTPPRNHLVKFRCKPLDQMFCSTKNLHNLKIIYSFLSQEKTNLAGIEKVFYNNNTKIDLKNKNSTSFDFIEFDKINNVYNFKVGTWNINKNLIIEGGHEVKINAGTELIFSNNSRLISYSPIMFNGIKSKPIQLTGLNNNNSGATGGITIINAKGESIMNYVLANNLSGYSNKGEIIFSGAVTFYNSDVQILNSSFFKNNEGDDLINIINSNFKLESILVENSLFDAIDIDYGNGTMHNIKIINSGNDALDFSKSNIKLSDILLINSGDKSISAGEASNIELYKLKINKSNIGIASKDSSIVIGEDIFIENTNIALAAYIKKPIYNRPILDLTDSKIFESKTEFLAELNKSIFFNNSEKKKTKFDFSLL